MYWANCARAVPATSTMATATTSARVESLVMASEPAPIGRLTFRVSLVVLLVLLVLWVPLPFGSVVPWSHTVLQITASLLLALTALAATRVGDVRPAVLPAICIAAVALFGTIQAFRLPPAIVRTISPELTRLQALARTDLHVAGFPDAIASSLSLAPAASRAAALTFAAVAACLLAAAAVRERRHRRVLALALLACGMFQVLYGASALASRGDTIWGEVVGAAGSRLRGTFINADHVALYLELVLSVAFAWGWWAVRRAREAVALERRIALVAGPAIVWVTLFVGLAFTGSRAGLIAAITGTVAQGLLIAASRRRWRFGAVGVLITLVGFGAVAVVGVQQGLGRWLATSQHELAWNDRLRVYATSWKLWERFPWTGTGLGTFRDAFPLLAGRELTGVSYWHAHNDYLELLVTAGVIGAGLLALALGVIVVRLARVLREGTRSEDRAAGLAALGAIAAVAVHSFFDFGLSMPANASTLAILVGAALAAGKTVQSEKSRG
jgi:putative inorganic carbon (HCO3(-)) transporter